MVKKIVIGAGVVTVLAFLVFGPAAFSHVKHAFHWARESVHDAVPIEYQLEQAERMIEDIIPEIEASKQVVAQEQVEIRYLTEEIARIERIQSGEGERIQARNAVLKAGEGPLVIAGRPCSRTVAENELRIALKKHQNNSALVESKRRLLDARRRSLAAGQHKLDTVCGEKENLEIAVEQLRARLRETQALEATSAKLVLDDTKLAEVQEILGRCRKRLDVAQQLLENEAGSLIETPGADEVPVTDVTAEVDRWFGRQPAEAGATAAGGN